MSHDTVMHARGLCKTYDTGSESVSVLSNLNLEVAAGSFSVIMGSSGSGKSTLLYLLGGLDRPDEGEIVVDNLRVDRASEKELAGMRRDSVSFVFQEANLVPNLTLLENVQIAGLLSDRREEVNQRARDLMKVVGIEDLADRLPSQVSGGEQQRCAVARALINEPALILADEPTGNLNSASTRDVLDLFRQIHGQGRTVIMVTHELNAACCGDRVCFMRDGAIIGEYKFSDDQDPDRRERLLFDWLSERGGDAWRLGHSPGQSETQEKRCGAKRFVHAGGHNRYHHFSGVAICFGKPRQYPS
ncbi:MAG: ABC transporter ATP-binding protein [Acidobacteriota bacterium]|nr:ABC transporter ATP-binding protein [Acidobacteriota bacterium]